MVVVRGSGERRRRSPLTLILIAIALDLVLLIIINAGLLLLRSAARPTVPQPGELLYTTSFDAYNQEWTTFSSEESAEIVNGTLVISVNVAKTGAYSDLNHDFSNFDTRIDSKWLAIPNDFSQLEILFRYKDKNNFYAYKLSADGYYSLESNVNGQSDILSARQYTPFALTGVGAMNQLRIVARSNHFEFYLNDHPLVLCLKGNDKRATWANDHSGQCLSNNKQTSTELVDATFDFGKLAVGAYADDPGVRVAFDNVLVYGPTNLSK